MAKLGQDGGVEAVLGGDGPLPGGARKPRNAEIIAARLAAFEDNPPVVEGVQPLAQGFFKMERLRNSASGGEQKRLRT